MTTHATEIASGERFEFGATLGAVSEWFFVDWESVGWWRKLQGLIKKFLSWRGIGTYGICRNIYFLVCKPR